MSSFSASGDLASFATALAGQYSVEREIGRGGMGVVYLARDLRLDRLVAIKTLPANLAADSEVGERFLREARTVARLSHPNIVPIHRADDIGGQVFFVMGFVDGASLADRLSSGPLSPKDSVPILRDVASALGYAHAHGVVHRDVKTENILLDSVTGRAMVTDFGIARLAEAAPLTATGQVLGTVYYLSPEQVAGDDVDARSDIYALGVVGYRMLAGKFPFDAPLASAVLVAHVMKQAAPLGVAAPNVPQSLASIIDRCLAKNPAYRFQSCADLEAALAEAQADANQAAPAPKPTPLVSDTEAHAIFKRAAELQDMTGIQPRPEVVPLKRDAARDAERSSGFKTADLRQAAGEAGISEKYVQHALAERGLGTPDPLRPDRRPTNIVHDRTPRQRQLMPEPTELLYEMVVNGEMPEEDYDLLLALIQQDADTGGIQGMAASVGRRLTWNGRSRRGRQVAISVAPRQGKTTISVSESLKEVSRTVHGLIMGAGGGGVGGLIFANAAMHGDWPQGAVIWGFLLFASYAVSGTTLNTFATKRRAELKQLLTDLGAQARESIATAKASDR